MTPTFAPDPAADPPDDAVAAPDPEGGGSVAGGASLGDQAARGFAWTMVGSVLIKFANLGGQIVLAWLLLKAEFGIAALALSLGSFAGLLREAGLQQVLVHRQRAFRRWAGPVFWLSLTLGGVSALALMAAAPVAARALESPLLVPLLVIVALSNPLHALCTVPLARVAIDLRFRFQAILTMAAALGVLVLGVAMAAGGAGAYSLIVPGTVVAGARAAALWWAAPTRIRPDPQWRRLKHVWGDSAALVGAGFFSNCIAQGDYLALGLFHPEATVGVYYFAFLLSTQTVQILTVNLGGVLFPALGRLADDPRRQAEAFLRATRLIAAVGAPLCLLQAALAAPTLRLLFGTKWDEAIPVVQILSVAAVAGVIGGPCVSLLQAQGRFRAYLIYTGVSAAGFVAAVTAGSAAAAWAGWDAPVTVALVAAVAYAAFWPAGVWLGLRHAGFTVARLIPLFGRPLLLGTLSAVPAWLVGHLVVDAARPALVAGIAAGGLLSLGLMALLLRAFERPAWEELGGRVRTLLMPALRATRKRL